MRSRLDGLGRGALLMGALGLLMVAVALGPWMRAALVERDPDQARIEAERTRRKALALAGMPIADGPISSLDERLRAAGLRAGSPVYLRIFKLEFELEVWMRRGTGFVHFATYPICRWSGRLGPKLREGDRQAPEGFYTVDASALNPHSRWHRSFNLGFPNAFDRAHARDGTHLMVHGGCSSAGCYAMTNAGMDDIWRLVTAALKAGQPRFHVHIFPFRMSEEALATRAGSRWSPFWSELKPAYDLFETRRLPPLVEICEGRYQVAAGMRGSEAMPIGEACRQRRAAIGPRRTG